MSTYAPPAVVVIPWTKSFAEDNGAAGAWLRNQSSAWLGGGGLYSGFNSPTGNYAEFKVALGAGTYTYTAIGSTSTFYGISTVTLNGTSVGTLDWYAAGSNSNIVKTITGITVTTAGIYTLRVESTTKNASATHYSQAYNLLALHRTDDASGPIVGGTLPHRVDIVPWGAAPYATSGSNVRFQSSNFLSGGVLYSSTTQNNYFEWLVPLTAGTWSLTDLVSTTTSSGIVAVTLGGTSIGTWDEYSGSTVNNVPLSITGITVAQDGIYKLRLASSTKHASSSAYRMSPIHMILQRTGS